MKYSELIDNGATDIELRSFLSEGEMTAITFRIPRNLKEAAAEEASLRGLNFSAFVRMCLINELSKREASRE